MSNFKEIVTKAVVGKSKKNSVDSFSVETEQTPNTVLGCWVINHTGWRPTCATGCLTTPGS